MAETTTERRAPLTDRQIELMLAVLIRRESSFLAAKSQLTVDRFASLHRAYAVVWSIVCDYHDEFTDMPNEDYIIGEIESRLDEDPEAMSPEESSMLDQYLTWAFKPPLREMKEKVAFKLLRRYLEDRLIDDARHQLNSSAHTPTNIFGLMQGFTERASIIGAIEPNPLGKPFPKGWDRNESLKITKIKTNMADLDDFMQGGLGQGEVMGLLGPHGSCKTTLGVQVACEWAKAYRAAWKENSRQGLPSYVYLFIYEGSVSEMRLRALSHTGQIARDSLEIGEPRALSTASKLRRYERQKFAAKLRKGDRVFGERTRYKLAQGILNDNFRVIDMTGNDVDNPGRGWGMVDEIASLLRTDVEFHRRRGIEHRVGGVIIDYVGAAVERYIDMTPNTSHDNLRHLLGKFPLHAKNKIAMAYKCPVIVLHQLSGTANSFSPGKLPKGTDSAECKSFRENLDWLIVVGNPTQEGRALIGLDKQRRGPAKRSVVIQIDGRFCSVLSTDGRWVLDEHTGSIVEAASLRQIATVSGGSRTEERDAYETMPGDDADEQTADIRRGSAGSM